MKYINATNVEVKFLDKKGHITKTSASSLRRGSLKNPYFPSVCGVGYIGVGIIDLHSIVRKLRCMGYIKT